MFTLGAGTIAGFVCVALLAVTVYLLNRYGKDW